MRERQSCGGIDPDTAAVRAAIRNRIPHRAGTTRKLIIPSSQARVEKACNAAHQVLKIAQARQLPIALGQDGILERPIDRNIAVVEINAA